jgi:uncharacterized protein YndB with AHSA1/START domain
MIAISNNIEIRRPLAQVFAFVAEVDNNPQWMPVHSVQKLSNPGVGAGTRFQQPFTFMGTNYILDGLITGFEPEKKISFQYDSPIFTWAGVYVFEPTAQGTRLEARGTVTLLGPLKMMETMFAPRIRKLINDTSPQLKKILES